MLDKEKLIDVLNEQFDAIETEKEMLEFNSLVLDFVSEICSTYAEADEESDEDDENEEDENGFDIS